ncbi:hypothetical protein GOODEAATRI_016528 [Goodea atripinnis]|uniref:RGS domain-containing protein n=1 Tax=Goodea atripinnis TaxID=208336 RepID=A0ABV0N1Y3_9TELE
MHCMDQRGADHLVRFWLEAESFRSASWSRVRAQNLNSVKHSSLAEPVSISPDGPELHQNTLNDLALHNSRGNPSPLSSRRDSSNAEADPKANPSRAETPGRQAPSRTGTPSKGPSNSTLRDLSDTLMKTKICGEDGMVDPNCFVIAQLVVFSILEQQTQLVPPVDSMFYTCPLKHKGSRRKLSDPTEMCRVFGLVHGFIFSHSQYMEKEEAMNILQFWLAADNFQNQLAAKKGQYDGQEAQNDAMILYDKYFSLQATNPLGFGDSVRMEIESNICREGGPLPDCFTTPLRQAWTTMEMVYLPGFLSSNLYYKYLSDLINSVRGDEFENVSTHGQGGLADNDRSSSNASESSQTQHGVKKAAIKILKNFDEAITVDVASLDPEMLYQRPYAGKMTFGKVNELGQFIREAEPEPDVKKSKGSMFSQAMKKWVQGNSDEEEMAWKIAKMIVNDVVHQSNHDSPGMSTKVQRLPQHSHFSFISPAWIVKDQLRSGHQHQHHSSKESVSFGLLWHCSESLDHMYRCYTFGGLGKFAEIPSSSWQYKNLGMEMDECNSKGSTDVASAENDKISCNMSCIYLNVCTLAWLVLTWRVLHYAQRHLSYTVPLITCYPADFAAEE